MRNRIFVTILLSLLLASPVRADYLEASLLEAVDSQDISAVREQLALGADVNARDNLGFPALMTAVRRGNERLVQVLLNAGADVDLDAQDPFFADVTGANALMWAAEDGRQDIVELLLDSGAEVDFWSDTSMPTALLRAAANGHGAVVQTLLERGAAVDQAVDGKTALHFAVREGYPGVVKVLLDYGADVNVRYHEMLTGGWGPDGQEKLDYFGTILMQAALQGDPDTIGVLLDQGAEINAVDACGVSALMFAVRRAHTDATRVLLLRGADARRQAFRKLEGAGTLCDPYRGTTALILAARDSHSTDIARMLLSRNADINATDVRGFTALMHACDQGSYDMAKFLIGKGSKVNYKYGPYTALYLAESHDLGELVKMLRQAGAK
ncbi:MAG: ankyrin repeat domain-containing protein [Candidatus Omnitrophica bacterium]|nr:ankyrin repeat domain-containing protein [Candidatus Omnitrophota bacterium]